MTQAIINDGKVGTFKSININIKFKAWLGHDNKYFDRVCADRECKGMYDSRLHQICPKCSGQLTFIMTSDQRPMGVSEGTFYPVLSEKQKESDHQRAMMRKGGTEKVYRFKMFSFGTGNVLAPPPEHAFCKKGALVEINVINHQSDSSIFIAKGNIPKVQEMYNIFDNYGDTVTLMPAHKADESRVEYPVDATGNPQLDPILAHAAGASTVQPNIPAQTPAQAVPGGVDALRAELNAVLAKIDVIESGGAAPNVATEVIPATEQVMVAAVGDEPNPFGSAS